ISDEMMPSYFELCTDVPTQEIDSLMQEARGGGANPKDVKRRLAREIVAIYHGAAAGEAADAEFERVHARGETPEDIPVVALPADAVRDGRGWVCRLLTAVGMAKGTGDARRLIEQGGVKIDGQKATD